MNVSKILWFKLPRIFLEIDFTHDVLIKVIMDTLQSIMLRLCLGELTVHLLMMLYDLI